MGKRIIKPNDPERLARVMDERTRMIGVRLMTTWDAIINYLKRYGIQDQNNSV